MGSLSQASAGITTGIGNRHDIDAGIIGSDLWRT